MKNRKKGRVNVPVGRTPLGRTPLGLNRKLLALGVLLVLVAFSIYPAMGATTFGRWRDVNPTQYMPTDVSGTLRDVYMSNGGSGSIGAGDGWIVGGDNPPVGFSTTPTGIISHYDGFSWQILAPPVSNAVYNSVNFCQPPGAPNLGGLCTVNTIGNIAADGWFVGTVAATNTPVASYWDGYALTEADGGLAAAGAGNLTSVFMVCHSPPFSLGCSGSSFQSGGLTYAAGSTNVAYPTGWGIICVFNGNPKAGGSWNCPFTSTHTHRFNSVYMYVDQSNNLGGFAVGENGWIAQLTSGGWTETQPASGPLTKFRSVMVDQEGSNLEAWAVGDYSGTSQVWHFCCGSAGSWNGMFFPIPTAPNLERVFLVSQSEGWIVGSGSIILHSTDLGPSNGNNWLTLTTPLQTATGPGIDLIGASFTSSGNGWAVGTSGVILNTQNSNCGNTVVSPCWGGNTGITQTTNLTAVFELGQSDAWAGGAWDYANNYPSLIHWDGQWKWHRATILPPTQLSGNPYSITSIYMSGSSDGWAVGGQACTPPNTVTCNINGFSIPGVPFAIHWDGNKWDGQFASQPTCPGGCSLTSVYMINSGEGWATGDGGQLFHYTSASGTNQWALAQTLTGSPKLNGVFISNQGSNTNAGWAVGNGGTIAELSISGGTSTWNIVHPLGFGTTNKQNLYGVYFYDSNHGWIVGAQGTILTTTDGGATWSGGAGQVVGATFTVLRSVSVDMLGTGPGNGDGWAVGGTCTPISPATSCDPEKGSTANNLMAHWDGQTWTSTVISPPIAPGLAMNWVMVKGTQDGFAVGAQPTFTQPSPPLPVPLAGIFHLDPLEPPVSGGGGGATTVITTFTPAGGATTVATTVAATTGKAFSTVTNTFTAGTTVTGTSNVVTTASLVSTTLAVSTALIYNTLQMPGIPGFPWESIIAGIMIGLACIGLVRRLRGRSSA